MAERWVLTAPAWHQMVAEMDEHTAYEAQGWLDEAIMRTGSFWYWALFAVLVDEGTIDFYVWRRRTPWVAYYRDAHHCEALTVRRRYRGPCPAYVLATFAPERPGDDPRVRFV